MTSLDYRATAGKATRLDLTKLRPALRPFRLHWYPTLGSTSSHAATLRRHDELFAPAVVLTGRQTSGRGRGHNLWWSPKGCLTVTFVWPIEEQLQPQQVPLLVGVALRRAAVELIGDESIQLKWPNDLLHRDRKLAGVLCERIDRCDLIGIGLNVCNDLSSLPKGLRDRATSLSTIAGKTIGMTEALLAVAKHLHAMLSRDGDRHFRMLLGEYDRHHALIGRTVTITTSPDEPAIRGVAQGLDSQGRLVLKHRGGVEKIISGQVNLHGGR